MAREDWKHAKELIPILEQGEQEVPKSLLDMAERYENMLKKKQQEEGGDGRGRGGRGSFHHRRDDGKFSGGQSNGGFGGRDFGRNETSGSGGFIPRGRRGRGNDSGGFSF